MAALKFPEIIEVIEQFRSDYILIDTPGQIELFAFREASSIFLNAFKTGRALILFVMDPTVAQQPEGLVSLLILSSSIQFRFDVPIELVLGKADLLDDEQMGDILEMCSDPFRLQEALGTGEMSMRAVAASEFMKAMETLGVHTVPKPVSSLEMSGIEDLYNTVQLLFFGGEDLSSD